MFQVSQDRKGGQVRVIPEKWDQGTDRETAGGVPAGLIHGLSKSAEVQQDPLHLQVIAIFLETFLIFMLFTPFLRADNLSSLSILSHEQFMSTKSVPPIGGLRP